MNDQIKRVEDTSSPDLERARKDPVYFAEHFLDTKLHPYQKAWMDELPNMTAEEMENRLRFAMDSRSYKSMTKAMQIVEHMERATAGERYVIGDLVEYTKKRFNLDIDLLQLFFMSGVRGVGKTTLRIIKMLKHFEDRGLAKEEEWTPFFVTDMNRGKFLMERIRDLLNDEVESKNIEFNITRQTIRFPHLNRVIIVVPAKRDVEAAIHTALMGITRIRGLRFSKDFWDGIHFTDLDIFL